MVSPVALDRNRIALRRSAIAAGAGSEDLDRLSGMLPAVPLYERLDTVAKAEADRGHDYRQPRRSYAHASISH